MRAMPRSWQVRSGLIILCCAMCIGSDQVRLIYVPEWHAVTVSGVLPAVRYRARVFDPLAGATTDAVPITAIAGNWSTGAPAQGEDWVLIVERE